MVEGLCKRYGDRHVLRGIDIEVRAGEVFALLGPNGVGKTTTVEILEGYRDPTAGSVRVLGFDPWCHARELRERTGVVLQECGFPNHLRVGELLDGWRAYYARPRELEDLLELVELRDERATVVRRLSGGQRRRLDFALALAGDPDLVFLDEPTTGFDPEARRRCWSAIDNLRTLGKTILLTTHYLEEAERLADRVAILTAGHVCAVGSPRELARSAGTATGITFTAPPALRRDAAQLLQQLDAVIDGDHVEVRTLDTSTSLRTLLDHLGDLPDLAISPPTLEDVYLQLVATEQGTAS